MILIGILILAVSTGCTVRRYKYVIKSEKESNTLITKESSFFTESKVATDGTTQQFFEKATENGSKVYENDSYIQPTTEYTVSENFSEDKNPYSERENKAMNKYKLIINGHDITRENHVKIKAKNTEIPLLAVMKELGANIAWNDKMTVVSIDCFGKIFKLDINDFDFGWYVKPGTVEAVRIFDGKEIIIDGESALDIFNDIGAIFNVNRDAGIIEIRCANS